MSICLAREERGCINVDRGWLTSRPRTQMDVRGTRGAALGLEANRRSIVEVLTTCAG